MSVNQHFKRCKYSILLTLIFSPLKFKFCPMTHGYPYPKLVSRNSESLLYERCDTLLALVDCVNLSFLGVTSEIRYSIL